MDTAETYNMELNLCEATIEVTYPDNWILYKYVYQDIASYTLFLNFMQVRSNPGFIQMLSRYSIYSDNDNITKEVSGNTCTITTDKYKYIFVKSNDIIPIQNAIGGSYNANRIEVLSVNKITELELTDKPEHYLKLDDDTNVLSYYHNNKYQWSKIISNKYTTGVYFILRDKIFAVIQNGEGQIEIFNLDGTHYSYLYPGCIEYIQRYELTYDSNNQPEYITFHGFIWNPHFLSVRVKVDSIFSDKLETKVKWRDDDESNSSDNSNDSN